MAPTNSSRPKQQPEHGFWLCHKCGYQTRLGRPRCACGHRPPQSVSQPEAHAKKEGLRRGNRVEERGAAATADRRQRELEAKVKKLEKELAKRNASNSEAEGESSEKGEAADPAKDIGALQRTYAEVVKTMGPDSEAATSIKATIEARRREKTESKPLALQIRDLDEKLRRRTRQISAQDAEIAAADAEVQEATALLETAKAKKQTLIEEARLFEEQLAPLRELQRKNIGVALGAAGKKDEPELRDLGLGDLLSEDNPKWRVFKEEVAKARQGEKRKALVESEVAGGDPDTTATPMDDEDAKAQEALEAWIADSGLVPGLPGGDGGASVPEGGVGKADLGKLRGLFADAKRTSRFAPYALGGTQPRQNDGGQRSG